MTISLRIDQLDHVEVFVRNIDAAVAWYDRILGLKVVRRWDPAPVMIGAGGSMIALFQARRDGPNNGDDDAQPAIRWRRVAWRVAPEEFEAAQLHLKQCHVEFTGPIDHDGPLSIYFNDLDGNPLEITCYP